MEKKQNYIYMIIGVVIFIVGLLLGLFIGMNINKTENPNENQVANNNDINAQNVQNVTETTSTYKPKLSKEERLQTALSVTMSEEEIETLRETIIKDEEDYGDNYQDFTGYEGAYKREPDRIYFKSPKVEGFYKFEKDDENYEHLLEVTEDRISYSIAEDYNLYCFTPDSISTMMTSGDNYIIFDYDNIDLKKTDEDYQSDLIFRFNANTRLFRLATSLSYDKELTLVEDLGKNEFARNTKLSGYKYITELINEPKD